MRLQKGLWMGIFIVFSLHSKFIDLKEAKNSSFDLVILTEDSLVSAFQDFSDLKWETGVTAKIVPISQVKADFPGNDIQEKIRNFIKFYHSMGTDYFLLAGDNHVIPARTLYIPMNGNADDLVPSDFYYMCLDGNFNDDGDTLFGEFEDSVDVFPDVKIGRLPVKNSKDVRFYLNKLKAYMFFPYTELSKAIFIGSDITTPGSGAQYCMMVEDSFPDYFQKIEFYETSSNNNSKDEVIDSLSRGSGFVYGNLHAQSFDRMLINFTPRRSITNYDVDNRISNYGKPGFYDIVTCHIGGFDTDALAEHLIRDSAGAIGVYATTRLNYPAITINLNRYFYGLLFHGGVRRMGDLDLHTRIRYAGYAESYINYRYVIFSYELFGDPTLKLWRGYPEPVNVEVLPESDSLIIEVSDTSGDPVADAHVVAYSRGSFLSTGTTDDMGRSVLRIRPGTMTVFIEKDGYRNFLDTVSTEPQGPYVRILDPEFSSSVIQPGDTVTLGLLLVNQGSDAAGDFRVMASSQDSSISFRRSEFTIERIDPGDTLCLSDSISFVVSEQARDLERFEIKILCAGRDTFASDSIQGTVRRSRLSAIYLRVSGDTLLNVRAGIINNGSLESRGFVAGLLDGNYVIVDSSVHDSISGYGVKEVSGLSLRVDESFDSVIKIYVHDRFSADTLSVRVKDPGRVGQMNFTPLPGGTRLSWEPVDGASGYAIFRDGGNVLAGFSTWTTFYDSVESGSSYRIAVVDSTGFCGELSEPVYVRPNLPVKQGFPVYAEGGVYGSPVAGEFDTSYPGREILIASFPYGYVYLYHSDGTLAQGWPVFLDGEIWASPAMADIDGDGENEAVVALRSSNEVHAFNGDATELAGWPVHTGRGTFYTPAIGDLDGDEHPEIVINDQSPELYVFRHDGSGFTDSSGVFVDLGNWWKAGSPVIFDYNHDLMDDIGIGIYREGQLHFSVLSGTGDTLLLIPLDSRISSPPVIGEFRQDLNDYEILINDNGTVKLFDHEGNLLLSSEGFYTAVAADVNFDGELDIIGTTDRGLKVISSHGTEILNMNLTGSDYYLKEPVVGDVDNDRAPEILFESFLGSKLLSVELDSSLTSGFPFNLVESPGYSIPVLDDIDGDGLLDIIVASTFDSVWVLETETPSVASSTLFPVEKYDYARTGFVKSVPTGRDLGLKLPDVNIYPTLTKGAITVNTGGRSIDITFYTIDGRVARRFSNIQSHTLKLKLNFPSGIYFFRIGSGDHILKTGKILLLR